MLTNVCLQVATYKGVEANSTLITWFWQVMEEFSNTERSLFLRFVWGRTRLPRTVADFRGRDFVLQVLITLVRLLRTRFRLVLTTCILCVCSQVLDKYDPPDDFLPESYTCFFLLKMPRYTSLAVLRDKLKYAIHFCKSIGMYTSMGGQLPLLYARYVLASPAVCFHSFGCYITLKTMFLI